MARDAACAGADRATNAASQRTTCPASMIADLTQVDALRVQMLEAVDRARVAGSADLPAGPRFTRTVGRVRRLARPEDRPTPEHFKRRVRRYHRKASRSLGRACRLLIARNGRLSCRDRAMHPALAK